MKVTVIVTTYNNPEPLSKAVSGLLNQKRLPDELIVADDGSGKETARVIKDFSDTAPFPVLHVWHKHDGFRAAKIRNKAIKRSSGDYIILLDGDCVANSSFVSDHLSLAERGCFVQGKRVHVNKKAVAEFSHKDAGSFSALAAMALTGKISNVHHIITRLPAIFSIKNKTLKGIKSCNMSFYRDDIMAVNGFNEDFVGWGNEDSELACRFFKYGLSKKVHSFMAICFHLWHKTNKTAADNNREILATTMKANGYICKNGLFKKG